MKKITLWLFVLFSCWQISAQVNAYEFNSGTEGDLESMAGSTQLVGSGSDDGNSPLTDIGFTFNYAGGNYTQFSAATNGFVRLGAVPVTGAPNYTNSAANAASQSPIIMPYWDDLATGATAGGGKVHYKLIGTAPYRTLVVEWFVTVPIATAGNANATFQLWLYETTNQITFVYGNLGINTGGGATIGLATSATVFNTVNVSDDSNSITDFVTNNALVIAEGTVYEFIPPACSVPGAIAVVPAAYTANITWTGTDNTDEYTWIVVADGAGSNATHVAWGTGSDSFATAMGLTPSTAYDLYIKADCGADGESVWSAKIDFTTTIACPVPTAAAATGVTHNSATLGWTSAGTTFEVNWGTGNFTAGDGPNNMTVTGNSFTFPVGDLLPNTLYRWFVRQDCSVAGDGMSTWTAANTFTTSIAPAIVPWTEGFVDSSVPMGWANSGYTTPLPLFSATVGFPAALKFDDTETYYMRRNPWDLSTTGNFTTISVGEIEEGNILSFDYKLVNYGDDDAPASGSGSFVVAISANGGVYTTIDTKANNGTEGWQHFEYDLSDYEGQFIKVRITDTWTSGDYYLGFDNFYIGMPPACDAATGLIVANITSTGAEMSWDEIEGVVGYEYDVTTSLTPPASGEPTEDTYYIAEDGELAPQTDYFLHVRTDCGGGDYGNWTTKPFKTLCASVSVFTEGFEGTSGTSGTATNLPNCWAKVGTTGSAYTQASTGISGSRNLYMSATSATTKPVLAMISVNNADAETHRMVMKVRANSVVGETVELGYLTNVTDATSFVTINSIVTNSTTVPQTFTTIPTGMPSGDVTFALRTGSGTVFAVVLIDNIVWEPIPDCVDQTGLIVTNITATGAEMSWEDMEVEGYEYFITTSATPPTSGISTSDTFYITAPGELLPLTEYYLHVRTDCGNEKFGIWASTSFKTACLPPNIEETTGGSVCGQGEVTLSATADAGTIAWYANQTGGSKLGEGETFTTPFITETTSYWVSAFTGNIDRAGKLAPSSDAGATATNNYGVRFTVSEEVVLNSVSVYAAATGVLNVKITDNSGNELFATGNVNLTETGLATPNVIPLSFYAAPGEYRILIKSYGTGVTLYRDGTTVFPFTGSDGAVSVTTSEWGGTTNGFYFYFYDLQYSSGCASPREEVIATVTNTSEITLSTPSAVICEGETMNTPVTLTAGVTYYEDFVWNPSIGVSGDAETGWTFNPTTTTTYTLTASNATTECATSVEFVVDVTEAPALSGINASTTEFCSDSSTPVELVAVTTVPAPYCSVAFSNNVEPITLVDFAGIYNATPATVSSQANGGISLENFTSMVGSVTAGAVNVPITLNGNTDSDDDIDYTNHFWVYIDWNQNGVFTDDGETYFVGSITGNAGNNATDALLSESIAVPSTALNGNTRMRVLKKFNASTNPGSCNTTGFGQAEDYTINVTGGVELDTYSWSDGTSVIGTESTLSVTPTATTTYTVTVTNGAGCSSTASVEVTYTVTPATPTAATSQQLNEGQTLADLVVNGTNLVWYNETGTVIPASTVAVDGATYYVAQASGSCVSDTIAITVEVLLSIGTFDNNSFRVYPNPTKNILNVSYSKEISTIELYNLIGQKISSKAINASEGQIDMSNLASGSYFIKVTTENASKTVKIIKE